MLKKIAFLLVLFAVVSLSVESLGYYEGKFLVSADNYVLQLPQNLAEKAVINNEFEVPLLPSIRIEGKGITLVPSINPSLLSSEKSAYSFKVSSEKEGFKIDEKVKIEEDKVTSEILIKNLNKDSRKISIVYFLNSRTPRSIFIADKYRNGSNYIVLTGTNLTGNSLGVTFSDELDFKSQQNALINSTAYILKSKEMLLEQGQSYSLKIIYYPFNLQRKEKVDYPLEYSSYLDNIVLKCFNTDDFKASKGEAVTLVLKHLESKKREGDGYFLNFHSVTFDSLRDSLDYSEYFKEKVGEAGVPARLVIGETSDLKKYAWVQVYLDKWRDINVFMGVREKPKNVRIVFTEPALELHILREDDNNLKALYLSTSWLMKTQQNSFVLWIILLILLGVGVAVFINLKSKTLEKKLEKNEIEKEELEGKYKILKKDKIEQEFIDEIFKEIVNKNGEVNLGELAEKFHYSKELVSFAIAYLIDNGFLSRGEGWSKEKKESKMKYSKTQKIAIGIITAAALILIIYLLIK